MGIFSRDAAYDMDKTKQEVNDKKLLLDVKVETQVILQLLVEKGIVTREEVQATRERVKRQPQYRSLYEYFDQIEQTADYYQNNPEQHLKDLFKAKMEGKNI